MLPLDAFRNAILAEEEAIFTQDERDQSKKKKGKQRGRRPVVNHSQPTSVPPILPLVENVALPRRFPEKLPGRFLPCDHLCLRLLQPT